MKNKQLLTVADVWHRLRDWLLISGVELLKRPYAAVFKFNREPWKLSSHDLMKFPNGSLGCELGIFLSQQNFELMDKLEDHDVLHVLLDIETTVKGEAMMQWILIGNGKRSLFCLFTGVLCWLLLPELRPILKTSFIQGKKMSSMHKWEFQYLLREPLVVLKKMLNPSVELKKNKNIKPFRF